MNERLKSLRKSLNLSQKAFGKQLGVTGAGISKIEKGERNLTEQMFLSICREFNVNEKWLRTGEGDIFLDIPAEDEYFKAATSLSNDPLVVSALIGYYKLNPNEREAVMQYLTNIINEMEINNQTDPYSDIPYDHDEFNKKYFPDDSNKKNGKIG